MPVLRPHSSPARELVHVPVLDGEYAMREVRTRVGTVTEGNLVTSRLSGRWHAPCLDLDYPSALTVAPDGALTVWVQGLGARGWSRSVDALAAAGLSHPRTAADRARRARTAAWEAEAAGAVDTVAWTRLLAAGRDAEVDFASLVDAAHAALSDAAGVHLPGAWVGLVSPYPIRLTGPALLLNSTRHFHLYLETAVDADAYWELFYGLAGNLVSQEYAAVSYGHGASDLRLPWVPKPLR